MAEDANKPKTKAAPAGGGKPPKKPPVDTYGGGSKDNGKGKKNNKDVGYKGDGKVDKYPSQHSGAPDNLFGSRQMGGYYGNSTDKKS
jgi:hypothetical protein